MIIGGDCDVVANSMVVGGVGVDVGVDGGFVVGGECGCVALKVVVVYIS